MKLPFVQWLIQGIPECIAVFVLGLALVEKKVLLRKALIPGLIQAIIIFVIRQFPLPSGLHTLVGFFSASFLFLCFAGITYSRALVVSLFVQTALGLSEYIIFSAAAYVFKLSLEAILSRPLLVILIGLPHVFILFFLSFGVARLRKGEKNRDDIQAQG
jgi:hypothetical protein